MKKSEKEFVRFVQEPQGNDAREGGALERADDGVLLKGVHMSMDELLRRA